MATRRRKVRRRGAGSAIAASSGMTVAAVLLSGSTAEAVLTPTPTVTVNTLNDPTTGSVAIQPQESLRDAITRLNSLKAGGTIVFKSKLSGTIHLASPLPTVGKPLAIDGPGENKLTIDGGGVTVNHAILYIGKHSNTSISGVTLENAHGYYGGAILSDSELTISDSRLTHNRGALGGAAFAYDAPLIVIDSRIDHNRGNKGSALVAKLQSNPNTRLDLTRSTVDHNTAVTGFAAVAGGKAPVTIAESTITGNTSVKYGSGVYTGSSLTVTDSTITGNGTKNSGGGGIYTKGTGALTIENSIVAANHSNGNGFPDIQTGSSNANASFSLIGDSVDTGAPLATDSSDIVGTASSPAEPRLSKLSNHGGPTVTRKPLSGSPVIDHGKAFGGHVDQRGFKRTVNLSGYPNASGGDGTDMGAVEVQSHNRTLTRRLGDQRVSVTTQSKRTCRASYDNLPVGFRARKLRHSHRQHLRFRKARFYLDKGRLNSKGKYVPNASTRKKHRHLLLPLTGLAAGRHTLRAVVTFTYTQDHTRHTRKLALRPRVNVCQVPPID